MAKAKKLPSGNWSCQAYSHTVTVNGKQKRVYERFTAPTRKEAEYLAAEFQMNKSRKKSMETMTVAQAIENYIDSKSNILSPSTIRSYRSLQRNHFQNIGKIPIQKLTRQMVQREFNMYAATLSPKTCRNLHGLLSAALTFYMPEFTLRTSLPEKEKKEMQIPTEIQLQSLLSFSKDTPLYLAILLAFSMGLRRGEICGLKWRDIDFSKNKIHVRTSVVLNDEKKWVEKSPKSFSGNRILDMPEFTRKELEKISSGKRAAEPVVNLLPSQVTNNFITLTKQIGISHIRFHDLRHYYASMLLANNVPDKYAMKRMGHATNAMLKGVYQHIIIQKEQEISSTINHYFSEHFQ